jgi:hypothetical protein
MLDEALQHTFPASDPISLSLEADPIASRVAPKDAGRDAQQLAPRHPKLVFKHECLTPLELGAKERLSDTNGTATGRRANLSTGPRRRIAPGSGAALLFPSSHAGHRRPCLVQLHACADRCYVSRSVDRRNIALDH